LCKTLGVKADAILPLTAKTDIIATLDRPIFMMISEEVELALTIPQQVYEDRIQARNCLTIAFNPR
jgi:hypothetical protein